MLGDEAVAIDADAKTRLGARRRASRHDLAEIRIGCGSAYRDVALHLQA